MAAAVAVPSVLRHAVADEEAGPAWLASLDDLVARAEQRWDLAVGEPFGTGMAAWTAPATTAGGAEVVLKLSFPHPEARDEAAALAAWNGSGTVTLLGFDAEDQALLLPRLRPGTDLTAAALPIEHHLTVGAELLRRMASAAVAPGSPFQDLRAVAAGFAANAEVRIERTLRGAPYPVDVGVCRHAVDLLRSLPVDAPVRGLAHGDLNPGNVLRTAAGWLAIDPKPVHGDLAYDPWPLLTQVGDWTAVAASASELADRARLVAEVTGLDAARIASWCTARSASSGLWAASRGWWTGFRGADGDLDRAVAWSGAATRLGG
ncbi:aminoglycoside phosphotransferase family protein [Aquihabitans sp. G128]|uniref:aminoglycoside phosphotransferase family protein n=1 Tax=Aquihabitans sp. G128 TaxID=2849779 RepID=UPI001C226025|nr:aminoglycoside phosphotransferase family protein [Aquihabitans sp. G128]QXC60837.1 aminoglycoside phosphotransferase family protein [Aquihabitans sp. G128]